MMTQPTKYLALIALLLLTACGSSQKQDTFKSKRAWSTSKKFDQKSASKTMVKQTKKASTKSETNQVPIYDLIEDVSVWTDKNVVIGYKVKGEIHFKPPAYATASESYQAFKVGVKAKGWLIAEDDDRIYIRVSVLKRQGSKNKLR